MRKLKFLIMMMVTFVTASMAQVDTNKMYRLKDNATSQYLTAFNYTEHPSGAYGGMGTSALAEDNEDQIFIFEQSGSNYKIKTKTGYYLYAQQWNVDALASKSTEVKFTANGTAGYYMQVYNTNKSNAWYYVKNQAVGGTYYLFGDAVVGAAATWTFEEVIVAVPSRTITVSANNNSWGTVSGGGTAEGAITITATPADGCKFVEWQLNGVAISTQANYIDETEGNKDYVAIFAEKQYCKVSGNMSTSDRNLNSITITDETNSVEVTNIQTAGGALYADKTDFVLTTNPGATLKFSNINWNGSWMQGYVFIDYNNDREFNNIANNNGTTGGELVTYNCYNIVNDYGTNILGEETYGGDALIADNMPSWTLPSTLEPGDYRLRFNVAWNSIDPCGYAGMATDRGAMVDITLRIVLPLEPTYNITAVANDAAMGSVTSAMTEQDVYTIEATANEGYEFIGWTIASPIGESLCYIQNYSTSKYLGYNSYNLATTDTQSSDVTITTSTVTEGAFTFHLTNATTDDTGSQSYINCGSSGRFSGNSNNTDDAQQIYAFEVTDPSATTIVATKATSITSGKTYLMVGEKNGLYYALTDELYSGNSTNQRMVGTEVTITDETITYTGDADILWKIVNKTISSTDNPYTVTVTEDVEYVANFQAIYEWPATVEVLATAEVLIAQTGVGFPTATSAAYTALQSAIEAATAAKTIEQLSALETAISAYYAETDVTMPVAGKTYALIIPATESIQYCLSSNSSVLSLRTCTGNEFNAESLFTCEVSDNKYMFKNLSDNKYLAIPTYEGMTGWSGNSATGLETEVSTLTKFDIVKLYNNISSYVTASNEELNGLVSLYGLRGVSQSTNEERYGVIVISREGRFDGANDYFCTESYTSAIKIVEVDFSEILPTYTVTVSVNNADMGGATKEVVNNNEYTLTATPNVGYEFTGWSVNGEIISTENPYTITVTEDVEYIANFQQSYCIFEGNSTHYHSTDFRYLSSFTITDGVESLEVSSIQSSQQSAIYVDKTESVFETHAGAQLNFSQFNWHGTWMHAYVYIDYDKDREFNTVTNADGTTGGEAVSYNFIATSPLCKTDGVNSLGEKMKYDCHVTKDNIPAWIIPQNLPEGDYRLRVKIDWNDLEPCGSVVGGNTIQQNGGTICDIIIRILPNADSRTISVNLSDDNAGSVTVNNSGTTITTAGVVKLEAEANENYLFKNWTLNGNVISTTPVIYDNTINDKIYTANFEPIATINNIVYAVNAQGNAAYVKSADASIVEAEILSNVTINGTDYTVTEIGAWAFNNCTQITQVTIPQTVTTIGYAAFNKCSALTSVNIPDNVNKIETWAFAYCTQLTELNLPQNLTLIYEYSFYGCTSLNSVVIPDKVTEIWGSAFSQCTSLETLVIGSSVQLIGWEAFANTALTQIVSLRNSAPVLDNNAFLNVSTSIPVYVPVGYKSSYQSSSYWSNFTNIIENFDDSEWEILQNIHASLSQKGWTEPWDMSVGKGEVSSLSGLTFVNSHVTGIDLSNAGITGNFPTELLTLPYLNNINLSGNSLSGTVEDIVAFAQQNPQSMQIVTALDISNNSFSGNIGAFATAFPNLVSLKAQNNKLSQVYPMISTKVTTLNLSSQTIDAVLDLNLPSFSIEEFVSTIPTILVYNHSAQQYDSQISMLCSTLDDECSIVLEYNNGALQVTATDKSVYYGENGETFIAKLLRYGVEEGSSLNMRIYFSEGDATFSGSVDVLDLQASLNYMFNDYNNKPFNFTAANLWEDAMINVQDIVKLVNILLDSQEVMPTALTPGSELADAADAEVYIKDGNLIINSSVEVAAFDILLNTGNKATILKSLEKQGFTCSVKQTDETLHLVGYSLSGATLATGETAICSVNDAQIAGVMLSDTDAESISLNIIDSELTSIETETLTDIWIVNGNTVTYKFDNNIDTLLWYIYTIDGAIINTGKVVDAQASVDIKLPSTNNIYIIKLIIDGNREVIKKIKVNN